MRRLTCLLLAVCLLIGATPFSSAADDTQRLLLSPTRWDTMGVMTENMIPVSHGGLFGYLTVEGDVAIPPQYSRALSFQNGFAYVEKDGRGLLLTKTGEVYWTLPEGHRVPDGYGVTPFREKALLVDTTPGAPGGTCFFSVGGDVLLEPQEKGDYLFGVFVNTVVCFDEESQTATYLTNAGRRLFSAEGVRKAYPFSRNNYIAQENPVVVAPTPTPLVVGQPGDLIITLIDSKTFGPLEGATFTIVNETTSQPVGFGTYTTGSNGWIVLPAGTQNLDDGDRISVKEATAPRDYYLDTNTKIITYDDSVSQTVDFFNQAITAPGENEQVSQAYSTLAAVQRTDGTWDLLDTTGRAFISGLEDVVISEENGFSLFIDGIMSVKYKGKYCAMNGAGQLVIRPDFDGITPVYDQYAVVEKDGKFGMVNRLGGAAIPLEYEFVDAWRGALAPVKKDGHFWLYDRNTKALAVDLGAYDLVQSLGFRNTKRSLFMVRKAGKYGLLEVRNGFPLSEEKPSFWAEDEVNAAILKNLVPSDLRGGYTRNITRQEFARMIIRLIETCTGDTITVFLNTRGYSVGADPFSDTREPAVLYANALGIVNGRGDGRFDPHGAITREEAAKMLGVTAEKLGRTLRGSHTYADAAQIAAFAVPYVGCVTAADVMGGVGGNTFHPKGNYTREQAIVTMLRLYAAAG